MTRIDRYILFLYARVLGICFASMSGLMVVVQVFTNLDEFTEFAEQSQTGLATVLVNYFAPYLVWLFEKLSGMLALLALLFVIAWLNKTHELTALLAAGVTKRRLIRPLLLASGVVVLGAAATRELLIPKYQEGLDRKPQDLTGDLPRAMRPIYDPHSSVLISGRHLLPTKMQIVEPDFKVQGGPLVGTAGGKLLAPQANYLDANPEHPAGYLFTGVRQPANIDSLATTRDSAGRPLLLTSKETAWLEPGSMFLVSDIGFESLRGGSAWKQYASTAELIRHLEGEATHSSNDVRVQIHERLLRPFVDWTVLLLGIPVLLTRPDRHMFWVAGACLAIVAGFTGILLGFSALGSSGQVLSPAMAVWIPLLVFFPWAWAKTAHAFET